MARKATTRLQAQGAERWVPLSVHPAAEWVLAFLEETPLAAVGAKDETAHWAAVWTTPTLRVKTLGHR